MQAGTRSDSIPSLKKILVFDWVGCLSLFPSYTRTISIFFKRICCGLWLESLAPVMTTVGWLALLCSHAGRSAARAESSASPCFIKARTGEAFTCISKLTETGIDKNCQNLNWHNPSEYWKDNHLGTNNMSLEEMRCLHVYLSSAEF